MIYIYICVTFNGYILEKYYTKNEIKPICRVVYWSEAYFITGMHSIVVDLWSFSLFRILK